MPEDSTSNASPAPGAHGEFPPTQWSIVLIAGSGSESQIRAALQTLCSQYWYPIYAFIRWKGRNHHEAEDCTQEFLARMLASKGFSRANPARGRFRTFLRTSVRNFLNNEWQSRQAVKRGGGDAPLRLEFDTADQRFASEPVDPGLTPEQAFDRNYALDMIKRAIKALRADYEKDGRGEDFARYIPLIWGTKPSGSLGHHAERFGMEVNALRNALSRLRERLGEYLRAEVLQTVADVTQVDDELSHLSAALGGSAQLE